jgi:hypothetical protein
VAGVVAVDELDALAEADLGLVQQWARQLGELIGPRFFRPEPRERALAYVKGLLSPLATRNGWTVAQAAGERSPDGMQRLLNQAVWDEGGVREDLRGLVVEHLGAPDGVLVFDETGDIKKGTLCRHRHKQPNADVRIMPTSVRSGLVQPGRAGQSGRHNPGTVRLFLPVARGGEMPESCATGSA